MELRQYTQKGKTNLLVWTIFAIIMAYVIYAMLDGSMSCIDNVGCVKSWCKIDWFPGDLKDKIRNNEKC